MSKVLSLAVFLLALIALAPAQTTTCQSTFSAGTGDFAMQFCVTENGNIAQYSTPLANEHLLGGTIGEGYGICDLTGDSAGPVEYYDYAGGGATSNWKVSTVDQPGGANTFPLTITRETTDGLWLLTQTFSQNIGERAVKVQMQLRNESGSKRDAYLLRYADIDANGLKINNFQATLFSAFGAKINQVGIQLRDWAHGANTPIVQNVTGGPSPCTPDAHAATAPFSANGSLELLYELTVPQHSSKTVKVLYRPI
jgi:hypothetical protein